MVASVRGARAVGARRVRCAGARRRVPPAIFAIATVCLPAAGTAQWVEPPGLGWASFSFFHQNTRSSFDVTGNKGSFPGGGHAVSTQGFMTLALGLADGLDTWTQFSFQRLRFDDLAGGRTSTGPGDIRLYLRYNPLTLLGSNAPVAIRGGVKLPLGDFDVGSNVIPLADGQRDWEVMLELGQSLDPAPFYFQGWVGYRWREGRDGGQVDYGDEKLFYAALGGTAGVQFKVAVEGWHGGTPLFDGVLAPGAEREMIRIQPSLLQNVGAGQVEIGVRWPLAGKNLPSGPDLVLGYFVRLPPGLR